MDIYDKSIFVRGLYHWIWYLEYNKSTIFWASLGGTKILLVEVVYILWLWLSKVVLTITWNFMDLYDKNKYVRGLYHWIWYLEFNKRIIFWAGLGGAKIWLVEVVTISYEILYECLGDL